MNLVGSQPCEFEKAAIRSWCIAPRSSLTSGSAEVRFSFTVHVSLGKVLLRLASKSAGPRSRLEPFALVRSEIWSSDSEEVGL